MRQLISIVIAVPVFAFGFAALILRWDAGIRFVDRVVAWNDEVLMKGRKL